MNDSNDLLSALRAAVGAQQVLIFMAFLIIILL